MELLFKRSPNDILKFKRTKTSRYGRCKTVDINATQPNHNPRATNIQEPNTSYITQKLQGYNKLIALPKTNPSLVKTCFDYGLLNTIYTQDGEELTAMEELYKIFTTYKRITKGTLFYIKCYTAPAEILYDEIKPVIQVVKIGLTRDMIIPEDISQQPEIPSTEERYMLELVIELGIRFKKLPTKILS